MKKLGLGGVLSEFKNEISKIIQEIEEIGEPSPEIPELIDSTNLRRSNDHFKKINEKKTQLLQVYSNYVNQLENLLSSVFEIQKDLKDLIKDQAELMQMSKTKKTHTKTKTRKISLSKKKKNKQKSKRK